MFAAVLSLLVVILVFPMTAQHGLSSQLTDTLGTVSELLLRSLHLFQVDKFTTPSEILALREDVNTLRGTLSMQITALRTAYEEAQYEITYSFFPMTRYKSFLGNISRLQNILVSKMRLDASSELHVLPEVHALPYLRTFVDELGRINLQALRIIRLRLALDRSHKIQLLLPEDPQYSHLDTCRHRLQDTVARFQEAIVDSLETILKTDESSRRGQGSLFRDKVLRDCYFFISLVQVRRHCRPGDHKMSSS